MNDILFDRRSTAPVLPFIPPSSGAAGVPAASSPCTGCRLREGCVAAGVGEAGRQSRLLIGRRRVRKGDALFREGQPFGYLYAVRYGTLKNAFTLDDGREQVTAFSFAGDIVGLEGIAWDRHATHAIALEDSEVCSIPYRALMALPPDARGHSPAVHLAQLASAELARDRAGMAITATRQADPRVAAFLLMLSRRMRESGLSGTDFELRMSRAEIGSYLGLTLESVSRAFSAFAERGWIQVHNRSVRVHSLAALHGLCQSAGLALQERHGGLPPERQPEAA